MRGWRAEPVAVAAAIRACILCAVAFGLSWTADQIAAVMLAVELVLALVLRGQVTTEQTLQRAGTSGVEVWEVSRHEAAQLAPVVRGRTLRDSERER